MVFPSPKKSPKRKREDAGSQYGSPSIPSSPRQPAVNLQESLVIDKGELGSDSPRSAVAGCLGHLEIYDNTLKPEFKHRAIATTEGNLPLLSQTNRDRSAMTTPTTGAEPLANNSTPLPERDQGETEHHPPAQKKGRVSTSPASSPKAKSDSTLQLDPERRSKSPPLRSTSDNPLTWSDSEITGHLGTDPDDDGYGINGLGFKPTPAIAWSRSERRKKQIAAWRTREASDARQSRRARRRTGEESNEGHQEVKNPSHKKVKFEA